MKSQYCCSHLIKKDSPETSDEYDGGYYRAFTGEGTTYRIICSACKKHFKDNGEKAEAILHLANQMISDPELKTIEKEFDLYGSVGEPEVLIAKNQRNLELTYRSYGDLNDHVILAIEPFYKDGQTRWLAITAAGELIKFDEGSSHVHPWFSVRGSVDFTRPIVTRLSSNQRFLAIANLFGLHGCVVDLETEKMGLKFQRGYYHINHCEFPIDFFEKENRTYLVHATEWNRLDITDVESEKCMTAPEVPLPEGAEPPASLDYFHGALSISPNNRWVFDNGWVWHPVGMPSVFNLNTSTSETPWKTVESAPIQSLAQLDYWPTAACWIDENRLVLDALEGDFYTSNGVRIIDVSTGQTLKMFGGPGGTFFYDSLLFTSGIIGFSAWDIETGERVLHSPAFRPTIYHRQTKQFMSLLPGNILHLGKIL